MGWVGVFFRFQQKQTTGYHNVNKGRINHQQHYKPLLDVYPCCVLVYPRLNVIGLQNFVLDVQQWGSVK